MSGKTDPEISPEKYTVDSNPHHYLTGVLPTGEQVIMGISLPDIWMYTLDIYGFPLSRKKIPLSYLPMEKNGVYVVNTEAEEHLLQCLYDLAAGVKLTLQPIEVQEFFDNDNYVGVTRYSREIEDFINSQEEFDEEEQFDMAEQIEEWNKKKYAVVCWCGEYTIDSQGKAVK